MTFAVLLSMNKVGGTELKTIASIKIIIFTIVVNFQKSQIDKTVTGVAGISKR